MESNVVIVCFGRFHSFDLARELAKFYNVVLITTYNKHAVMRFGVPECVTVFSYPFLEVLNRARKYLPLKLKNIINVRLKKEFSKRASKRIKRIKNVKYVICWSGSALEVFQNLNDGIIKIVERGSSHIEVQQTLLNIAYRNMGLIPDFNAEQIEREIREYDLSDKISIPSTFVKNTFIGKGICSEKLWLNPYGVNLQNFRNNDVEKERKFTFIFCGWGSVRKGYHILIQAMNVINTQHFDEYQVIHLGNVHPELKSFCEKYSAKNLIEVGHKPQQELVEWYNKSHCFILPTFEDGFAMVILQAMACGLPILTSRNCGGPDCVSAEGVEGITFEQIDVNNLVLNMLTFIKNKDLAKIMGENSLNKSREIFSWKEYGDRYRQNLQS